MKKFLALLSLVVLAALTTPAQSANINHFSFSGSAAGFSGTSSMSMSSTEGMSYQFTQHVSLGFQNIQVPNLGGFDMAVAEYATPLSSILGKSVSSKLTFNSTGITVTALGGAGKFLPTVKSVKSNTAVTAGVVLSFPSTSSANGVTIGPILQAQWVHSAASGNGLIYSPNSAAIAAGLNITFN